jgi:hypothetical protein
MAYRKMLSFAAVIFSTGYLIRSFQPANAFPQGPNIGTGSNPMVNFYESSNSSTIALDQTQDFVITTILSSSTNCFPNVNGTDIYPANGTSNPFYYNYNNNNKSFFLEGKGNLVVPAGQALVLNNCSVFYIEGYYVHP